MTFFDDLGVNAFPTIFTPQGDGNSISGFLGCQVFISLYSRQYLPRKGTETQVKIIDCKLTEYYSRQYLPRKGTETQWTSPLYPKNASKFPTIFTPQGDGNLGYTRSVGRDREIPDNIYPARGRKQGIAAFWILL